MIAVYRINHRSQIRQFQSELLPLIAKGCKTWAGGLPPKEGTEAALKLITDFIDSPRTVLLIAVDDEMKARGFLYGVVPLGEQLFVLQSFYVKEEVMQQGFTELFNALDRFCYQAGINKLEFKVTGDLPYSNPRFSAFLRRFSPSLLLQADLEKQNYADIAGVPAGKGEADHPIVEGGGRPDGQNQPAA